MLPGTEPQKKNAVPQPWFVGSLVFVLLDYFISSKPGFNSLGLLGIVGNINAFVIFSFGNFR